MTESAIRTKERAAGVRRVLWQILSLNLAVTVAKLVLGVLSGSLSITADGFHSLVDSSSNIIGLVGAWVASRPADHNHPYGHHKYETLATGGIGGMLLVAAFEIGRNAVSRLVGEPVTPDVSPVTLGIMAGTFVVNLGVTLYETRAAQRLSSDLLRADAAHTRADLLVTLSVMASLIGTSLGYVWLDPAVAGAVVLLLVRAAFGILLSTSEVLSDVAVADPDRITAIAAGVPGVHNVSGVRSRGREDATYVDLNIRVHPAMDTDQAHSVATEVAHRIGAEMPGVLETLVHIEPELSPAPGLSWETIALRLRALADGLGLGLHDVHAHLEPDGGVSIETHLELSASLTLSEAHAVADHFERRVRQELPQLRSLVTHLEPLTTNLPGETAGLSSTARAELRARLIALADEVAGRGRCHQLELHDVGGHLMATLHVTEPGEMPLDEAHAVAERIERRLHAREPRLSRVTIHIEPPDIGE